MRPSRHGAVVLLGWCSGGVVTALGSTASTHANACLRGVPSVLQTASDCGSLEDNMSLMWLVSAPYAVVAVAAAGAGDAASGAPGAFSSARRNATSVLALVALAPEGNSHA